MSVVGDKGQRHSRDDANFYYTHDLLNGLLTSSGDIIEGRPSSRTLIVIGHVE